LGRDFIEILLSLIPVVRDTGRKKDIKLYLIVNGGNPLSADQMHSTSTDKSLSQTNCEANDGVKRKLNLGYESWQYGYRLKFLAEPYI